MLLSLRYVFLIPFIYSSIIYSFIHPSIQSIHTCIHTWIHSIIHLSVYSYIHSNLSYPNPRRHCKRNGFRFHSGAFFTYFVPKYTTLCVSHLSGSKINCCQKLSKRNRYRFQCSTETVSCCTQTRKWSTGKRVVYKLPVLTHLQSIYYLYTVDLTLSLKTISAWAYTRMFYLLL